MSDLREAFPICTFLEQMPLREIRLIVCRSQSLLGQPEAFEMLAVQ